MLGRILTNPRLVQPLGFARPFETCPTDQSEDRSTTSQISIAGHWVMLVALLLTLVSGCGDGSTEDPEQPAREAVKIGPRDFRIERIPPVVEQRLQTQPVKPRLIQQIVAAPGEVALDLKRVAKVTSRIEGQVEKVHVQLGDRVRRGQPLVAIGSLKLDELVQEYLVSKTQAEVAEDNLRRVKKLRADEIIAERQLVEARGHHLEAKARYEHVREKLLNMALTEEELRELEVGSHSEGHLYLLKAPLSGTVVSQNVVLGQGVSPGIDLLEVVDTDQVWVFANLPIEEARRFKKGDKGTIVPKGGKPFEVPLAYIAPLADEKTRTVQVRFDVPNRDGRLRPHEYVEVQMAIEGSQVLAVPVSAVTQINSMRGVFVQRETGYDFVPVRTGSEGGSWVQITTGLTAGEQVVTAGVFELKSLLLKETIQTGE
ncbi:MAG: efflux RND transporter periplasmic adaptor subunit [Nitrospiraceae bacterium]